MICKLFQTVVLGLSISLHDSRSPHYSFSLYPHSSYLSTFLVGCLFCGPETLDELCGKSSAPGVTQNRQLKIPMLTGQIISTISNYREIIVSFLFFLNCEVSFLEGITCFGGCIILVRKWVRTFFFPCVPHCDPVCNLSTYDQYIPCI